MQDDRDVLDLEGWIEPCIGNVAKFHFANERNDDAATVVVEQPRLGNKVRTPLQALGMIAPLTSREPDC